MQFSNTFKVIWWILLFIVLTLACIYRLRFWTEILSSDKYLFAFWCILALFPIVSEMSLLGVSVKKDIEKVKDEVRSWMTEIKNIIQNNNNRQNNSVNFYNSPVATKKEVESNREQEIQEESKIQEELNTEILSSSTKIKKIEEKTKEEKKKIREEKLLKIKTIEKEVWNYFLNQNINFRKHIKIEDNNGKNIILDGIITGEDGEEKIVEIKLVGPSGWTSVLYFIMLDFLEKLGRYNIDKDVIFVIVSENMDTKMITNIQNEFIKVKWNYRINKRINISGIFFKFENNKIHLITN